MFSDTKAMGRGDWMLASILASTLPFPLLKIKNDLEAQDHR